jgi:hypothetical protein
VESVNVRQILECGCGCGARQNPEDRRLLLARRLADQIGQFRRRQAFHRIAQPDKIAQTDRVLKSRLNNLHFPTSPSFYFFQLAVRQSRKRVDQWAGQDV